jgi:NTE family protein
MAGRHLLSQGLARYHFGKLSEAEDNANVCENMNRPAVVRCVRAVAVATLGCLLTGCAYVHTERLPKYDLSKGYRFDSLPLSRNKPLRNSEQIFVVLAFSGGGTRAAAMSYGVLAQLREVKFHFDTVTGTPVSCTPTESPRCKAMERSLLDEVDVMSSVSGGSFTSAYYALYGDSIFNRQSTFQDKFLYHRVQSDLVKQMFYYPRNWKRLRSRIEIAADYYARNVFGNATYADLEKRTRPYLILNATDASTGARFEFTQEQFDLLCADLSKTPVARGVASSSAFPVLLNSLTVDSYNAQGGCGYRVPTWEVNALSDKNRNPWRYRRALEQRAFRDTTRKHLHILDGGLADNVGLRGVLKSLESTDIPNDTLSNGSAISGGWSLLQRLQNEPIKHLIVITVDARTHHPKDWDKKASGPGIVSVVDASAGVPMGNFTTETIELMRATINRERPFFNEQDFRFHAMSLSLDDVAQESERSMLNSAGTNFELPEFVVNCLMSRGAGILREGRIFDDSANARLFRTFVATELKGSVNEANIPSPTSCSEDAGKKALKASSHTIDIAVRYGVSRPYRDDIDQREGFGATLRVAKPDGVGASIGIAMPAFGIPAQLNGDKFTLGRVRLYGIMGGAVVSRHLGPIEIGGGVSAGYAFGNFRASSEARAVFAQNGRGDMSTRSTGTWLAKPTLSVWHSLTGKVATTVSASYFMARPVLRFGGTNPLPDRTLHINALQLTAGIGYRIF